MVTRRFVIHITWAAALLLFAGALVYHGVGSEVAANYAAGREFAAPGGHSSADGCTGGSGSRPSLREAMDRADANWRKTVAARNEMIAKDWKSVEEMETFPAKNTASYFRTPYTIWDMTPPSYTCPYEMERVGRLGDGGKWVCGMTRYEALPAERRCVVYSFGVQYESSFENELLSHTNCTVFAYDYSVEDFADGQLSPANRDRAHFFQRAISRTTDKSKQPPHYSIADLMKENGHEYVDIMKMDIEFAEFDAMDGFVDAFEGHDLPVGQFMVEIHLFNNLGAKQYLDWWERLEARGLRPTFTEANLLAVTTGQGPIMAEYTMLNVEDKRSVVFDGA